MREVEDYRNEIDALRDQLIIQLLKQLRKKLWHYKNLIMVMGEPSLAEEFFLKEAFPRIIKRAAGGKDENLTENSSKFLAEDLQEAFEKANPDVINAKVYNYLNDLNSEDGFNDATILLNEIVDEAIKNSFKFNLKQNFLK